MTLLKKQKLWAELRSVTVPPPDIGNCVEVKDHVRTATTTKCGSSAEGLRKPTEYRSRLVSFLRGSHSIWIFLIHAGFLPQGCPHEAFAPPKIWSEDNRKISITIDFAPLNKIPGRKPTCSYSKQFHKTFSGSFLIFCSLLSRFGSQTLRLN